MAEAYIIDTVLTPVGKRGGSLSQIHPADLGAHTLKALVERTGIDPGAGDGVLHSVAAQGGAMGHVEGALPALGQRGAGGGNN